MTEFAILNADNEVTSLGWFDNEPTAHRILAEHIAAGCVGVDGLHVGEVCPNHDEAGRDGCKYCAAKTVNGYDYRNQAYVINGRYYPCGHAGTKWPCDCYGRLHAGEPVAANADVR